MSFINCSVFSEYRRSVACITTRHGNSNLLFHEADMFLKGQSEIFKGVEVLTVTNRKFGTFTCPGGKVDPMETLQLAAEREMFEEVGVEPLKLTPLISLCHEAHCDDDDKRPWNCMMFYADFGFQQPVQKEADTIPEWRPLEDIINPDLTFVAEYNKRALKEIGWIQ